MDLRHLRCAAGALAQRVNRGSGSSPSTPTRGSARPAAGDAKSSASGASTGECLVCMDCCNQLACWQPLHSLARCQWMLTAPKPAQNASNEIGARLCLAPARRAKFEYPFSAAPSRGICCSVHGAALKKMQQQLAWTNTSFTPLQACLTASAMAT